MKKDKKQTYFLTKYVMYNIKIDVPSLVIDKVGLSAYNHFRTLVNTMDYNNGVYFDKLGLKKDGTDKIRTKLHKAGFIRKIKLNDDIGYNWYLNPYLANKDNRVNSKLEDIFRYDKDNKYFLELNF